MRYSSIISGITIISFFTVFRQGDEGKAWYIIMQGAVIVETYSKGVVETLYEGEDFGGLALIHNVPRYLLTFKYQYLTFRFRENFAHPFSEERYKENLEEKNCNRTNVYSIRA